MSSGDRRILRRFCDDGAGWPWVLPYALRPDVYRQSGLDNLILRAVLVGGKQEAHGVWTGEYRGRTRPVEKEGGRAPKVTVLFLRGPSN